MRHCALATVVLLLFTSSGCGDKSNDNGGGSGDSLAEKIVGKWELDVDEAIAGLKAQGRAVTPEMEEQLRGGQAQLEFKTDGTATGVDPDGKKSAKWKATGESGNTLNIDWTQDGKTNTMQFTFSGDDEMTMSAEGVEEKLPLNRAE